mmetsp:Transcript_5207/g.13215  ORF Transcript_5207/g.13215 Transcript_5207/m.13215 type:complete len:255 (+) Transcript_5207:2149-2913(+)
MLHRHPPRQCGRRPPEGGEARKGLTRGSEPLVIELEKAPRGVVGRPVKVVSVPAPKGRARAAPVAPRPAVRMVETPRAHVHSQLAPLGGPYIEILVDPVGHGLGVELAVPPPQEALRPVLLEGRGLHRVVAQQGVRVVRDGVDGRLVSVKVVHVDVEGGMGGQNVNTGPKCPVVECGGGRHRPQRLGRDRHLDQNGCRGLRGEVVVHGALAAREGRETQHPGHEGWLRRRVPAELDEGLESGASGLDAAVVVIA